MRAQTHDEGYLADAEPCTRLVLGKSYFEYGFTHVFKCFGGRGFIRNRSTATETETNKLFMLVAARSVGTDPTQRVQAGWCSSVTLLARHPSFDRPAARGARSISSIATTDETLPFSPGPSTPSPGKRPSPRGIQCGRHSRRRCTPLAVCSTLQEPLLHPSRRSFRATSSRRTTSRSPRPVHFSCSHARATAFEAQTTCHPRQGQALQTEDMRGPAHDRSRILSHHLAGQAGFTSSSDLLPW